MVIPAKETLISNSYVCIATCTLVLSFCLLGLRAKSNF